jgi:hypothetical protein
MSETVKYSPLPEPEASVVTFFPKNTEHPEPRDVNTRASDRGDTVSITDF